MKRETVKLRLLKPWKIYDTGDVVEVPEGMMPLRMIRNKTAVRYVPEKKEKKESKKNDD